jgi:hypothetical protein
MWVTGMSFLINRDSKPYFRWHDSGDIQDREHLDKIVEICNNTPEVKHWLPTREYGLVRSYLEENKIPDNLCVRISAPKVNGSIPDIGGLPVSTIHRYDFEYEEALTCPAPTQGNNCGECRACWNTDVKVVSYHYH